MKKLLLPVAILGILASPQLTLSALAHNHPDSTHKRATPEQEKRSSGIDLTALDTTVRPQDDFFTYVNGTWLKSTEIPADKSRWGGFSILRDQSTEQVKALIMQAGQSANSDGAKQIGDLYNSFMNEKLIQEKGLSAVSGELAKVDVIKSRKDLTDFFAYADIAGYNVPFGGTVYQDLKQVENYIPFLWQAGLGLPDRDYYSRIPKRARNCAKPIKSTWDKSRNWPGSTMPKPFPTGSSNWKSAWLNTSAAAWTIATLRSITTRNPRRS